MSEGGDVRAFDYAAPRTVPEATALLAAANGRGRVLAGGTDVIVQLREGRRQVGLLVDVKHIPDLNELRVDPQEGLRLGAAVPCCRICEDPAIARTYPGLIDAVSLVGGIQIQTRASVGGNLCNASPAADTTPPLIVLRAVAEIAGPAGRRHLPVEDFCVSPGQTALGLGEILVGLRLPPPASRSGAHYQRFTPRNEMDIAVVGVGAAITLEETGRRCVAARVALGAVGPRPLLALEAAAALIDRELTEEDLGHAAEQAQQAAQPISDLRGDAAFRRHLVGVLTRRVLRVALARAHGG